MPEVLYGTARKGPVGQPLLAETTGPVNGCVGGRGAVFGAGGVRAAPVRERSRGASSRARTVPWTAVESLAGRRSDGLGESSAARRRLPHVSPPGDSCGERHIYVVGRASILSFLARNVRLRGV